MSLASFSSQTDKVIKRFQQALGEKKDMNTLWKILNMASKTNVVHWKDENGLDLLHYCIFGDNVEATNFLLKQGYFVKPLDPSVSPYLHLAALLGFKTILTVLLQHRPDDFRVSSDPLFVPVQIANGLLRSFCNSRRKSLTAARGTSSSSDSPHSSHSASLHKRMSDISELLEDRSNWQMTKKKMIALGGIFMDGSKPLMKSPLEVAALARRLQCVKLLLDLCVLKANPDVPSKGPFTLATVANCPPALTLLFMTNMKLSNNLTDDIEGAVKLAVQNVQPECLDLLLNNLPPSLDIRGIFKNINFYHVLYSLSASYGKEVCSRLPEVTRVLISKGHDVNARHPPRTYPLYTLMTHAFCYHDHVFAPYYVECLKQLLSEGADPNYDEVESELELQRNQGLKFSAGRNAFTSALSCLLKIMETNIWHIPKEAMRQIVEEGTAILVSYGADMGKVGRIQDINGSFQGTILHQFAKSSVTMGVEKDLFRCLVRNGADPDIRIGDKYAINVYLDKLFELLETQSMTDTQRNYQNDVNTFIALCCRFMTPPNIKEATFFLKKAYGRTSSVQVKYYFIQVLKLLEERSRKVRTLTELTSWKVWLLCCRRIEFVHQLEVSEEMKGLIVPLSLEIGADS